MAIIVVVTFIIALKDSKTFLIPALNVLLGDKGEATINENNENMLIYKDYKDYIFLNVAIICFICFLTEAVNPLKNYLDKKYLECINIMKKNNNIPKYPRYEDIKFYKKTLEVDATDVCPISYDNIKEIKQKVFYRGKIFDYHYLMLDYSSRLNARDHTGQAYDKSLFFRLNDKKIKYI